LLLAAVAAALTWAGVACGTASPPKPSQLGPVEGRTSTGAGVVFDFPSGWEEVPLHGPYTKSYESDDADLHLDVSDVPTRGESVTALGEQAKRRFGRNGTVVESGPTTVDGHQAYKVVVDIHTQTGKGLVYFVTVLRKPDRATAFVFSSKRDARPNHRRTIEEILSTIEIES
jgi:hypothetical protein